MADSLSTTRRTVLKGLLLASVTPGVAIAPELPATLGALIIQHSLIVEQQDEVGRLLNSAYKFPGMPEEGVFAGEIDPTNWLHGKMGGRYFYEAKLDSYFDECATSLDWQFEKNMCNRAHYEQRKGQLVQRRHTARALLAEREAAFAAWRIAAGLEPLEIEADRLAGLESDLDDKILAWRCETMDDVRLKARHIAACYGDNLAQASLNEVIKSFLI